MSRDFISGFASDLEDMIRLKVSLGYAESTYLERATGFDRYCYGKYPEKGELTQAVVMDWLGAGQDASGHCVHGKAAFVRGLGRYLASVGKTAYILPERFTCGGTVFIPYLFGDSEMTKLFHEIDTYEYPKDPFRPILLSVYFRMTYTCGLRPGEGRNLKRNEVDLNTGEIRIIESKRCKSRIVVMSDEMSALARAYAVIRNAAFKESSYFFPAPCGGPYSATWMQGKFKRFFARSKPDTPKELLPSVRVYDLRYPNLNKIQTFWKKYGNHNKYRLKRFGFYFYPFLLIPQKSTREPSGFFHFAGTFLSFSSSRVASAFAFSSAVMSR